MLFSVIVPNYNSPMIDRTLESLARQSFDRERYEVIVVGMDQHNLIRESPCVRFDRSAQRLSAAAARNRGAAQADGEVLAFIDADCIAQVDWLAVLAERFADQSVNVVGGGVSFEAGNYWTFTDNLSTFHEYLATHAAGVKRQLPSLNFAVRRDAFRQVGGYDERYPRAAGGEDIELTLRLRRQGYRLNFEPRAMVRHAPPRNRLRDLLRHGFNQGKYSTKVDPRYARLEGLPWPLYTRWGVLIAAPLLATLVSMRVLRAIDWRKQARVLPAVWLNKFAWCVGAACRPRGGINWGQK